MAAREIGPVFVNDVQVRLEHGAGIPQIVIRGDLPDPCHLVHTEVGRLTDEPSIDVEVWSSFDPDEMCAQVLEPFETSIDLPRGQTKRGADDRRERRDPRPDRSLSEPVGPRVVRSLDRAGELLPQEALEDLARRVPWQLVDERSVDGDLEPGDLAVTPVDHVTAAQRVVAAHHHGEG